MKIIKSTAYFLKFMKSLFSFKSFILLAYYFIYLSSCIEQTTVFLLKCCLTNMYRIFFTDFRLITFEKKPKVIVKSIARRHNGMISTAILYL